MFSIYCVRDVWATKWGPSWTEDAWMVDETSALVNAGVSPVDRVELLSSTVYKIMLHEPVDPTALVYALNHPKDWQMIYQNNGR